MTKGDGKKKLLNKFVGRNILVTLVHEQGCALGAPKNFPILVVTFVEISSE